MRLRKKISRSSMGSAGSLVSRSELLPAPQVTVANGTLQGRRIRLKSGVECDMYLGVPFAKPPVGELRFRSPQPPDNWDGVLKCGRYKDRSVQSDMFWDKIMQTTSCSEDCLYLNVFGPAREEGKTYPVMFHIHGGGWMMDSPARMVPKKLCRQIASRGVILVTVTYRLGFLGFFSTGDEACWGNLGLRDQALALRWTADNIRAFGGDASRITVSGQSAGSASTDLLSLSPLTRDLFSRKILMGGSAFCHWATNEVGDVAEYCRRKAMKLGWQPRTSYASRLEESEDMLRFLRGVPAHRFATTMHGNRSIYTEARLPLTPVIGDDLLPKSLSELRDEAPSMESIIGGGRQESLLFTAIGFLRCNEKDLDAALHMLAKKSTTLGFKEVTEIVSALYGDASKFTSRAEVVNAYCTLVSDIVANYPTYKYLKHSQAHDKATFAFSYDYTSKWMFGWLAPLIPQAGGTHSSEIIYLFDVNYFSSPFSKSADDIRMCGVTADYFTAFVKTGNPSSCVQSVTWNPVSKTGDLSFFCFDLDAHMESKLYEDRMRRFRELKKELKKGRKPVNDERPPSATARKSSILSKQNVVSPLQET